MIFSGSRRFLVDRRDLGVAVVAFDVEIFGVAVAAVDLTASFATSTAASLAKYFAIAAAFAATPSSFFRAASRVSKRARLDVGLHVGEFLADRLVFDNRLAELLAFVRVLDRIVEGGLCDADCLACDRDTAASQD